MPSDYISQLIRRHGLDKTIDHFNSVVPDTIGHLIQIYDRLFGDYSINHKFIYDTLEYLVKRHPACAAFLSNPEITDNDQKDTILSTVVGSIYYYGEERLKEQGLAIPRKVYRNV